MQLLIKPSWSYLHTCVSYLMQLLIKPSWSYLHTCISYLRGSSISFYFGMAIHYIDCVLPRCLHCLFPLSSFYHFLFAYGMYFFFYLHLNFLINLFNITIRMHVHVDPHNYLRHNGRNRVNLSGIFLSAAARVRP